MIKNNSIEQNLNNGGWMHFREEDLCFSWVH